MTAREWLDIVASSDDYATPASKARLVAICRVLLEACERVAKNELMYPSHAASTALASANALANGEQE